MQYNCDNPETTVEEKILYNASLEYLFNRYSKVAFFGETEQTEKILSIASPHHKSMIQYIVTEYPAKERIQDIPIVNIKTKPDCIDLVVVCADKNEKESLDKAKAWAGESTDLFAAVTDSVMLHATRTPKNKPKEGWPLKMYILCTGQRTGSTLLITLLRETGVLGTPTEQFRIFLKQQVDKGIITYDDILPKMLKRYQTPNGVFGVKIHGYQYPIFKEAIRSVQGRNQEKINKLVNNSSYIFLIRNNMYRQAISLWRAQKTTRYHMFKKRSLEEEIRGVKEINIKRIVNIIKKRLLWERQEKPSYRYDELRECLLQVIEERKTWKRFFKESNIKPLVIMYETFITQTAVTIREIGQHVGFDVPEEKAQIQPPSKKMADEHTEEVLKKFQRDIKKIDPYFITETERFNRVI